jgi:hypothetical protein
MLLTLVVIPFQQNQFWTNTLLKLSNHSASSSREWNKVSQSSRIWNQWLGHNRSVKGGRCMWLALLAWQCGRERQEIVRYDTEYCKNWAQYNFLDFWKRFFPHRSSGLVAWASTKEFERNLKKIRIFKRVAYLVFIVLCPILLSNCDRPPLDIW